MSDFRFGLMIRAQYPVEDDLAARFEEVCATARLADELGFDCITKGSHYAATGFADFQQIPFLARIMAEAPRCRLNAGVVLLPLHKPLDIAEQFATLDVMSRGKVILSVALGYREVEYKAYVAWGQSDALPDEDSLDTGLEELIRDRFLIGSPDEVTASIVAMARTTGVNHLIMSMHWPGMDTSAGMDAMRLFAEEVMPAVRAAL